MIWKLPFVERDSKCSKASSSVLLSTGVAFVSSRTTAKFAATYSYRMFLGAASMNCLIRRDSVVVVVG